MARCASTKTRPSPLRVGRSWADRPPRRSWSALDDYTAARRRLLSFLKLEDSNWDPFAEFAEHLVAALTGNALASNSVQASWDICRPDG